MTRLYLLMKNWRSLMKFGIIGCVAFATDFSITGILKDLLYINGYLANVCGFVIAVMVSFYLNKKWTFQDSSEQHLKQFKLFFMVSFIGLLLNTLFLFCFYDVLALNFYFSKALAAVLVFFWNFFANSFFTFKGRTKDPSLEGIHNIN